MQESKSAKPSAKASGGKAKLDANAGEKKKDCCK